ncbi:MAG: MmcQ/YjbR family DNA-binding protein [FCB group bacterium]|nr:MmcQ/YjbR family DNA-binding protein [FCB group bacterium]
MTLEKLKRKLLTKKRAVETYPFDEVTMVIKVMNKMFALVAVDKTPLRINLKCDPDDAQVLRNMYPSIIPGYYMNKEHWNTIILDGSVPEEVLDKLIEDSYRLVVKGLRKADREKLGY